MKLFGKKTSLLITAFVAVVFTLYFVFNTERFRPLLEINIYLLGIIVLANFVGIFTNGLFTKFILEPFNKFISVSESLYVSVISSIGNFFAPAGTGFGIRALYLKKKHGLPYSEFISTLSGNYVIVLLINSFMGLVALYFLRDQYSAQYLVLTIVFSLMFVVSLALSLIRFPLSEEDRVAKSKSWLVKSFFRVIYGWSKIVSNKWLILRLISLVSANFLLATFMYWAIIESVHLSIGIPELLLFTVLGSLTIFINITPANLGVKEAIYLFSSSVLGFSVSDILLIAIVDRGVQFTVLFTLWIVSLRLKAKERLNLEL
ncbi:MAG: lysylphosphatidylglycerol synthase transmembrane domain-containing protein [Candidatus Saccharimonadales bacterium]